MAKLSQKKAKGKTYERIRIRIAGVWQDTTLAVKLNKESRNQLQSLLNDLESNLATNTPNPPALEQRLKQLDPKLRQKFIKMGLIDDEGFAVRFGLRDYLDDALEVERKRFEAGEIGNHYLSKLTNTAKLLCGYFGQDQDIRKLTALDAEKYRDHRLYEKKRERETVASEIKYLRGFFQRAVKGKLLLDNPFAECKLPLNNAGEDPRRLVIEPAKLGRVEQGIENINWRALFAVCRWTGCRVSEAMKLKWSQVDFERGRITMPSPKTAKRGVPERKMPLYEQLLPTLLAVQEHHKNPSGPDYVIQDILNLPRSGRDDKSRPSKNAGTTMKKLVIRAGETPWPKLFQNLRVSRENELLRSNEYSQEAIHLFIGHSRKVYQSNYRQLGDEDFVPRSQRVTPKFPTDFPRERRAERSEDAITFREDNKNRDFHDSAGNCRDRKSLLAPRVGLEPTT